MFISVGKMFGKGKLRFGVGIRLTKSNFMWMAFVAMFYYMFKLMWYMILFTFWLMYAMCYGIWWCIKKIFKIGAKGAGKVYQNVTNVQETTQISNSDETTIIPATKEEQGDYAKTIFLWANQKASPVKKRDEYPSYLFYECGIQDAAKYHDKMIKDGFFIPSPVQETLSTLKVDALKEILSSHGQPVSGKKTEIIERILVNVPEEELVAYVSKDSYSLSDTGKKFLEAHNDYVLLHTHRNWGIEYNEYVDELRSCPGKSFYDVCWGIFNKRIMENGKKGDLSRNVYFNMHQLLMEEGKKQSAFEELVRVFYLDLSGYDSGSFNLLRQGIYKKSDLLSHFDTNVMIAPGIVKALGDLQDYYNKEIVERVAEWKLPFNACSPELFAETVDSIIKGTFDEVGTLKRLKQGYEKAVKSL